MKKKKKFANTFLHQKKTGNMNVRQTISPFPIIIQNEFFVFDFAFEQFMGEAVAKCLA